MRDRSRGIARFLERGQELQDVPSFKGGEACWGTASGQGVKVVGVVDEGPLFEILDRQGRQEFEEPCFRLLAKARVTFDLMPGLPQAAVRLAENSFGLCFVDHGVIT